MKRFLVIALLLVCCVVPAGATTHDFYTGATNGNDGYYTTFPIIKIGVNNITDITSLVIDAGNPYPTAYSSANDRSGSFTLKNASGYVISTGSYSSTYSAVWLPGIQYHGHMHDVFTFTSYNKPAVDNAWTLNLTNGMYWGWDGGLATSEPPKSALLLYYSGGSDYLHGNYTFAYTDIDEPFATSDFIATPLAGAVPLPVTFTDTSTNASTWNWSVSPPAGVSIISPTAASTNMYFGTIGNYTITHGASNYANSDIETKVDYIYVYNSTALITTEFAAMDATSGYNVNNVQIDLQDIENASWTNTTAPFGRAWISTLAGHTINAYASTLGYSDADLLAQPALGPPVWYSIQMFPTGGFTNVTDGLVTLYITVKDDLGNPIPGATIFGGGSGYGVLLNSSMFSITTNEAGIASIAVPNKTNIHMTASKTGYQTTSQVVYSGVGSGGEASVPVTIMLPRLMVTPTVTATTLPGGATPHPTIDPYTLLSPEEKQTSLANMVLDVGPALVGFFIVLTFIGGIKMIGKK